MMGSNYPPPPLLAFLSPMYATSYSADGEEKIEEAPWDSTEGWVPRTKSGKQKSPNQIRNELQRYIDECKHDKSKTQSFILSEMGVNSNSFGRFMNPKTYKDPWAACQNGTYWAAARLLERVKLDKEEAKKAAKASSKRKAIDFNHKITKKSKVTSVEATSLSVPLTKAQSKIQAETLVQRILAVPNVSYRDGVFDTCPQVVTKVKDFLAQDGVTKSLLLSALDINAGSLNTFLAGKKQDQCGNVAYRMGYEFMEKYRVLQGIAKSKARLKNELEHRGGFKLVKQRAGKLKYLPGLYY